MVRSGGPGPSPACRFQGEEGLGLRPPPQSRTSPGSQEAPPLFALGRGGDRDTLLAPRRAGSPPPAASPSSAANECLFVAMIAGPSSCCRFVTTLRKPSSRFCSPSGTRPGGEAGSPRRFLCVGCAPLRRWTLAMPATRHPCPGVQERGHRLHGRLAPRRPSLALFARQWPARSLATHSRLGHAPVSVGSTLNIPWEPARELPSASRTGP